MDSITIDSTPQEQQPNENGTKGRSRKALFAVVFLMLLVALGAVVFMLDWWKDEISTREQITELRTGASSITLGSYEICNIQSIELEEKVPIYNDGKLVDTYLSEDDALFEGQICETDQGVILAVDADGLHGSINLEDDTHEVRIISINSETSSLKIVEQTYYEFTENAKVEEQSIKWQKYLSSHQIGRRNLNAIQPGSVDIHIYLDIDGPMKTSFGSTFAAARYGVELIAIVNRDAFWDVGFNLKVVGINMRDAPVSNTGSTNAYLSVIERIPLPDNVNLMHSLTTARIGGGLAYVGGLYSRSYEYGVSASLGGNFGLWDRVVVAHELGHNFGAPHTHDMNPPVDVCGLTCPNSTPDNTMGTIMSYCHTCSGGMGNIRFQWASRVQDIIVGAYQSRNTQLLGRRACQSLSTSTPDVGVPFYLKGNECLTFTTSACSQCSIDLCTMDSAVQFDGSRFVSTKNGNFCWETSANCNTVSLQQCNSNANQQFSFQNGRIISQSCGEMKYEGSTVRGNAGSPITEWCHPDSDDDIGGPVCDSDHIQITCGQTLSGSSASACQGRKIFEFTASSSFVTVSTCGSSYDTMLQVYSSSARIASGDDEGDCGRQTVLTDIAVASGGDYRIEVTGYGGAVGDYSLSLTCENTVATTPPCDSAVIPISCGETLTGSTVGKCDQTQAFAFQATSGTITVSTCQSSFDTMLSIGTESGIIASGDDDGNCGYQTILSDVGVQPNTMHTIFLTGYARSTGAYRLSLTCSNPPETTTIEQTTNPPVTTTIEQTTLDPTFEPTMMTTTTSNPTTLRPTFAPTTTTMQPTTLEPSKAPSVSPSPSPTTAPTSEPTTKPSSTPTSSPTASPILELTVNPSAAPTTTTTESVNFEYKVLDGCGRSGALRNHGFPGYYDESFLAEVQCCSMDGNTCTRKKSQNGVCLTGRNNAFKVNLADARALCEGEGMRLCRSQVELDRCCGSGCSYDRDLVWTDISRVVGSSGSHMVACGKPGRCSGNGVQESDDDELRKVRCVSDTQKERWHSIPAQCPNLWWESDVWGSCKTLDYTEAVAFCESQGARLPTLQEVQNGCTRGSGCNYDRQLIWTSTSA